MAKSKEINTPQQDAFLNALFDDDVAGDIRKAMKKAGYSDNTAASAVITPLKDQIIERSKDFLALNTGKAIFGLINVLDSPNAMGAGNKIAAAKELLDRVGVIKQDNSLQGLPKGAVILLPAKEIRVIEGEVLNNDALSALPVIDQDGT